MMGDAAAATATRSLDRAERAVADALARRLAAAYPEDLLEVRVFGSRARGDHREDSDLDVAVILAECDPQREDQVREFAATASEAMGYRHFVNTHPHSLAEIRYFHATNSLYYRGLRDDGIAVWRKPGVDLWDETGVQPMGRELDVEQELGKAHQDLQMARIALDAQMLDGVGHSAYYAAFHAITAALLTRGRESKSHEGTLDLFSAQFANQGLVPKEYAQRAARLYDLRLKADYPRQFQYVRITKQQAQTAIHHAEELVADLERLCRDWLERQRSEPGS